MTPVWKVPGPRAWWPLREVDGLLSDWEGKSGSNLVIMVRGLDLSSAYVLGRAPCAMRRSTFKTPRSTPLRFLGPLSNQSWGRCHSKNQFFSLLTPMQAPMLDMQWSQHQLKVNCSPHESGRTLLRASGSAPFRQLRVLPRHQLRAVRYPVAFMALHDQRQYNEAEDLAF